MPPCSVPAHISTIDVDSHPLRKPTARRQTVSPPTEMLTGFFRRSKGRGPPYHVRGRCRGWPTTDNICVTVNIKISIIRAGRVPSAFPTAYRSSVVLSCVLPAARILRFCRGWRCCRRGWAGWWWCGRGTFWWRGRGGCGRWWCRWPGRSGSPRRGYQCIRKQIPLRSFPVLPLP